MDDPQRAPREKDRTDVGDRIRSAAESGLISTQDRDIRLTNVSSAQSMAELEMIVRDLDVAQQNLAQQAQAAQAQAEDGSTVTATFANVEDALTAAGAAAVTAGRRIVMVFVSVLVFALIGAAITAFVVVRSDSGSSAADDPLFEPAPMSPEPEVEETEPTPTDEGAPRPAYRLTRAGIEGFLATYRERFGTTLSAGITFYDDYVVMDVPVQGTNRHQGWLYRPDSGFTDFGGVTANFPGTRIINLRNVDVPALIRNLSRAKRTLNVEEISLTYVVIRQFPSDERGPAANIYVSNEFNESGYLATTIAGEVLRAYPYAAG